ncbi:hypothetical protein H0H92_008202, partial [Tricholoma furcatifolium]
MNASHVLGTAELLFQILSYSDDAAVVKGLQVSQFWFAVGKPIIWRAISSERDLWHLLLILIPHDQQRTAFDPPSDKKWERFIQYSTLVRYLCIDLGSVSPHQTIISALRFLVESRPVIEVFPAVKTLKCRANSQEHYLSFAFLHSGVQRWIFDVVRWNDNLVYGIQFGQLVNLTQIEVGYLLSAAAEDLSHIFATLEVLPLEIVSLAAYGATYAVLASLSRFASLREIRRNKLSRKRSPCSRKHHISSRFGVDAFPNLVALTISGCPYVLSIMLDDENFPYHIRSLTVHNMSCTTDPVPTYQKIVAKCHAVTEFFLDTSDRASDFPFSSLRPFLSPRLTRLVVYPNRPLSYDAIDIEELARSLPSIEDLDLGTTAMIHGKPLGTFTFDHLLLFSSYCPRLTKLGMLLDVTKECNPSPPNFIPFSALQELDLAGSFLIGEHFAMSADHVLGTPELLFQILSYSTNAAVVEGLQVSQFWFAVGKPIIWRAIMSERELRCLLVILIPSDQRSTEFDLPSDQEWERFLQYSTLRWIIDVVGWDDVLANRALQFGQMRNITHVELGPLLSTDNLLRIFESLKVLSLEVISLSPYTSTHTVLASLSHFQSESLREIRTNLVTSIICPRGHYDSSQFR